MSDDPSAGPDFAAVYDEHFSRVYNYVRWRVADAAAADDVAGRVFERALGAFGRYDPRRAPVDAWLFAIARACVADHFRARRLRAWLPLDLFGDAAAEAPRREDALVEGESRRELAAALGALDARERELLALKFGAGMTNRAIAAELGLGESHVGVIVHRAVLKLRARMEAEP